MFIYALNIPMSFELNFTLNFFTSSGLILIFSFISRTFPLIWSTIGYFETFFIYKTSYNLCPTHRIGFVVVKGLIVNLGSCKVQEHTTVTSAPSKTLRTSLYVKLY